MRSLGPGDYGASPPNATHTFQIVEPNTDMYGVVFDGGLEQMFFAIGVPNMTYPSFSPYDPTAMEAVAMPAPMPPPDFNGSSAGMYDIISNPDFVPRTDIVNGSAPAGTGWHSPANTLPSDPTAPYYVARDFGPKYLNSEGGSYQVIQPLNMAEQSVPTGHNFTLSFINMSMRGAVGNASSTSEPPTPRYAGHAGFRVEDGAMILTVEGYEPVQLLYGDVAFVPGNTSYSYYAPSPVSFTRVLHFAAEVNGLDTTLIARAVPWNSPVWPTT